VRPLRGFVALWLGLFLVGCTPAPLAPPTSTPQPTPVAAPVKVVVGTFGSSSTNLPFYAGIDRGLFLAEGIDLEVRELANNIVLIQGLLTGEFQVLMDGEAALNSAATGGAPFVFTAANQQTSPYQLLAAKGVTQWSDLKGGRILVGTKGSSAEIWTQQMLAANGLRPGDYTFLNNGNNGERYAALTSGQVQAALLAQPFDIQSEKAGYTSLGPPDNFVKDLQFNALIIRRDWGEQHRPLYDAILRATRASIRWTSACSPQAKASIPACGSTMHRGSSCSTRSPWTPAWQARRRRPNSKRSSTTRIDKRW
jgi:NitT/TauT family transport system substrate-binding protein